LEQARRADSIHHGPLILSQIEPLHAADRPTSRLGPSESVNLSPPETIHLFNERSSHRGETIWDEEATAKKLLGFRK
jgi:hypothetical protein